MSIKNKNEKQKTPYCWRSSKKSIEKSWKGVNRYPLHTNNSSQTRSGVGKCYNV